jgi:hypothetical protein
MLPSTFHFDFFFKLWTLLLSKFYLAFYIPVSSPLLCVCVCSWFKERIIRSVEHFTAEETSAKAGEVDTKYESWKIITLLGNMWSLRFVVWFQPSDVLFYRAHCLIILCVIFSCIAVTGWWVPREPRARPWTPRSIYTQVTERLKGLSCIARLRRQLPSKLNPMAKRSLLVRI